MSSVVVSVVIKIQDIKNRLWEILQTATFSGKGGIQTLDVLLTYTRQYIWYTNKRNHNGRFIIFQYDIEHPVVPKPETSEYQYTPVDDDSMVTGEMIVRSDSEKSFNDMTDEEKENFLLTSY